MIETKTFFADARCALVIIDLQRGIVGRETKPHAASDVVARTARLVEAFHARVWPVIFVHVSFSPDGADAPKPLVDEPAQLGTHPEGWDQIVPELGKRDSDILVRKRNWGAFYGTDLDLQLRRRGIAHIVLTGISTTIGVESTARDAFERNYKLLFVEDAMAAMSAQEHAHSLAHVFPRIGIIRTTADVLGALQP
ncbi:MAG: hydrolase [Vulcanimicrobiaceae bacterium]